MDVLDRADLPFPHSLPEFLRWSQKIGQGAKVYSTG